LDKKTNTCVLFDFRENNVYMIDILNLDCNATCLNAFNKVLDYSKGDRWPKGHHFSFDDD